MFKLARKSLFFRARTVGGQYQESATDYHLFILREGKHPIQITGKEGDACKEEDMASLVNALEKTAEKIEALPNKWRGYITLNIHAHWLNPQYLGNGLAYWVDEHPGYYSGEIGGSNEVIKVIGG